MRRFELAPSRRTAGLGLLGLLAFLGAVGLWLSETSGPSTAAGVAATSSSGAVATSQETPGSSSTARPPPDVARDPEALAAWFRERVRRELAAGTSRPASGSLVREGPQGNLAPRGRRRAESGDAEARPYAPAAGASVPSHFQAAARAAGLAPEALAQVDWHYLEGVFQGRISGVPNPIRVGLDLQEIDQLGDIPYVEKLRWEERFEELRDLGFENETVPWPACIRIGACRKDRRSSP